MNFRRGEVWYVCPTTVVGHEQQAGRPAVIVSNNRLNKNNSVVEVVYMTTQPKAIIPEHVPCSATNKASTILCEQITSVSVDRITSYITTLTPDEMKLVEKAILSSLNLQAYDTEETESDPEPEQAYDEDTEFEDTDDTDDYITELEHKCSKAEAERDTYKMIYENLLNKVIK